VTLALEDTVQEQIDRRRRAVAEAWELRDEIVLVGAGEPLHLPGRADLTYRFRAHSEYLYLTDRERPGGVLAFDPAEGWVDFVEPVTRDERLWEGAGDQDGEGVPLSELSRWLEARKDRRTACLGAPLRGISSDPQLERSARAALNRVRRPKDELELSRMRAAERATSAGFAAAARLVEAGRTERELQIELEAELFRQGADGLAFDTIVGGGPNSAVLHFPPSDRPFGDGELVLVDAGAEVRGYDSDITRTFPVSGSFSPEQAELYGLVLRANRACIELCVAGTEWRDVHRKAGLVLAEGLVDFGLLRGEPDALVESGAVHVFFPHGVGHMVGLGARDAGEALPGREPPADAFPRLRVDLPLEPGYVMTVEPGVYFVRALVQDIELRQRYGGSVDWERAEQMLGFGGIRIEDDVLVTAEGNEVLTADVPVLD
jgi:Xaa-Pro aminopeptidase